MGKKKKTAYWLLPAAALCLASVAMCVGQSQARYDNSAIWHTVAEPARMTVSSDYLEQADQPPLTVLLGQTREVTFTLQSSGGVSGGLTWSVDQPEYSDVQMKTGEILLIPGDTVSLDGAEPVSIAMTLTPTPEAAELPMAMDVNIQVAWSDALAATFRAELSAAGESTPEETQPQETQPQETEPEETQPTEPEETPPETTADEAASQEIIDVQPDITLAGPRVYHPELMFPLQITCQKDAQVSLNLVKEENTEKFPQGTRFSLDMGKSWFMLYREGAITLNMMAGTQQTVMLDLTATALAAEPELTITAGEDATVILTAKTQPIFQMSSQVLTTDTELTITFADLWQDCELVCSVDMLVSTENGKTYVPAEISQSSLMAELSPGESGQQLTVKIGDTLPQPGTYRIKMSWHYNGSILWQDQTSFFINYTGKSITKTGGDRQ